MPKRCRMDDDGENPPALLLPQFTCLVCRNPDCLCRKRLTECDRVRQWTAGIVALSRRSGVPDGPC